MKNLNLVFCVLLCSCLTDTTRVVSPDASNDVRSDVGPNDSGEDTNIVDANKDISPGEAPTVLSTSPENSAISVDRIGMIEATFSEGILPATINAISFTVKDANDIDVAGQVTLNDENNTAIFTPDVRLDLLTEYIVTLSATITDLEANPLGESYSWSFSTVDGEWTGAVLIESDDREDAEGQQIEFDSDGNAIAVWQQSGVIWAKRFEGGVWNGGNRLGLAALL